MKSRRFLYAFAGLTFLVSAAATSQTQAQAPSASTSAKPGIDDVVIDFEKNPPKERDTKLDPVKGWDKAPRALLFRTENVTGGEFGSLNQDKCDLRVQGDWLRVWCKAAAARVHQLSGDTKNVVVHISNQMVPNDPKNPWSKDDRRRLALYVRLVPGEVTILEATGVSADNYNGRDWEGGVGLLTVDWVDESRGPRILLTTPAGGYSF